MTKSREQYTMGYGRAATSIMAARTAESHATFFLDRLKPGMSLLDCGCGPGTITLGFAELVAPGHVVGTEIEASQVALARETAARKNISNIRFEAADIYELPFEEASFDAVFISAVIGNLREPVRGLREAQRVLKPGGVIGVKEFDHGGDIIHPSDAGLEKYAGLYFRMRRENGHDPESGRKIGTFLLDAGFSNLEMSASYESFATPAGVREFAEASIGLLVDGWSDEFESRGWATKTEIEEMTAAWKNFAAVPGAIFAATWCEAIAEKQG
jgi:ubiquinone/menaquinone biosynthesis C-methylase UbiE